MQQINTPGPPSNADLKKKRKYKADQIHVPQETKPSMTTVTTIMIII